MGSLKAESSNWRLLAVFGPAAVAAAVLFALPPLPQPASYHAFTDQRTLLGIPHCLNVLSNSPFLIVGVLGLYQVLRRDGVGPGRAFLTRAEVVPYALFFAGVALTAFGSAYYHLHPTNERLLWDRLPMALAFTSLFAAVLGERVSPVLGRWLLLPLVVLGVGSVLYWHWTEQQGHGDLRPYFFVQFYPGLALPLLLLLFPPRYSGTIDLWLALGLYVLAKVCEHTLDARAFAMGHLISGHTLKHLTAAGATYAILHMVRTRHQMGTSGKNVSEP